MLFRSGAINKQVLFGSFIELLRNRTLLNTLGSPIITDLVGSVTIPAQTGGGTAYWVTEGNAPTTSSQAIGQVALTPNTLGAFTDISRKFLRQTSMDAEAFVRNDLATVLAIELDRAAMNGSGSGAEPKGILQNSSVGTVAMGATGAAPTYAKMVEMETAVAAANADVGTLAYVTNAKVRGVLKSTLENASSAAAQWIWRPDNTVNGYRAFSTNNIPSDLTKSTGSALSAAIFGNWADLIIAMWGALDVTVVPYSNSTTGAVRVVLLQELDIKLRHAASFQKIVDIVA